MSDNSETAPLVINLRRLGIKPEFDEAGKVCGVFVPATDEAYSIVIIQWSEIIELTETQWHTI